MFTKENAREMQLRAWRATMERTSPERRSLSARRAAMARWYPIDGNIRERLHCQLRFLARIAKQLELEEDYGGAARTVMAMLPIELELLELRAERTKVVPPTPMSAPTETKGYDKLVTDFAPETPSPDKKNLLN